jgi:hypothetical protein
LTEQLRKERQAYLSRHVESSKNEQQALTRKVEDSDKMLANGSLATLDRMREILATRPAVETRALADYNLLKRCACILSDSGTRLGLGGSRRKNGRWGIGLNQKSNVDSDFEDNEEEDEEEEEESIDLESFVLDYCSSVEIKMERVQDELEETQAFNDYLESKVLTEPSVVSKGDEGHE